MTRFCSEIHECESCTAQGCIWCGVDSGCHAEFSPYGCIASVTCNNIKQCMRKNPQALPYKDYANVNILATIMTVIVAVILLYLLWMIMRFVTNYRIKQLKLKRYAVGDLRLEQVLNSLNQPLPSFENDRSSLSSLSNSSRISIQLIRKKSQPKINVNKDKTVKCTCYFISCFSILIVLFAFCIVLLFPTTPRYYSCNSESDWNGIWSSIIHGSPQMQYDGLFTIENNNYLSVELSNIGVRLYYGQSLIGYYYSTNPKDEDLSVYIPSHSIIDVLVPITFSPGISQAYTIWSLYQENNLSLEIDLFADTRTYLFGKERHLKLFDMHVNLQLNDYIIGVNITTDRSECKCPKSLP